MFLGTKYNQYSTYLPPTLPQKNPCSFENISACQSSNIKKRTFLYIVWGGAGFCSEMNQILLAFAYSVATKRRFLIYSRAWNYGNFADYFNLPSTNYYPQSINRIFLVEDNRKNDLIDHLITTRVGTQLKKFWLATRLVQSIPIKRRVAHYLWKSMSNETFKFIETHRIRNLSNYIGIHIRKGDKKREARVIPLNKYIKGIERILQKNKAIQQIFVASDDHNVVKELRQLKPTWNFVSIYDNNHQINGRNGHFQGQFNRLSRQQKLNETRLFMCELQMLVNSEYVLCGMSSNVCRLVQILRHQHPSTAISLDRNWYAT